MGYKVMILGKSYDLPARTLNVDDMIESISETDRLYQADEITRREAVTRLHGFVEELAPGALPSLDEVDTNDLMKACLDIIAAYDEPNRKERMNARLAEARDLLKTPEFQKILSAIPYMKK